jgi:hypothetical protein
MADVINPGQYNEPSLNPCNDKSPIVTPPDKDPPVKFCDDKGEPNLNRVETPDLGWLEEECKKQETGVGRSKTCDPVQQGGYFAQDVEGASRSHVYRYNKTLYGCDEALNDLFKDIVVRDINGKMHIVPVVWGSQERAVAVIMQDNVRKDDTLVTDRLKLPLMALYESGSIEYDATRYTYHMARDYLTRYRPDLKPGFTIDEKYHRDTVFGISRGIPIKVGYTLIAWSLYIAEMNQIVEQILLKCLPLAYITIRGVHWESVVKLDSIQNNIEHEPGEKKRAVKYQFNLTAETYIPQPLTRKKAVLKTDIEFFNTLRDEKLMEVIDRIIEEVKQLEQ